MSVAASDTQLAATDQHIVLQGIAWDLYLGSLDKMAIDADIEVLEVWRWQEESLQVFELVERRCEPRNASVCLQTFPFDELSAALAQRHQVDETTLSRRFREALQTRQRSS